MTARQILPQRHDLPAFRRANRAETVFFVEFHLWHGAADASSSQEPAATGFRYSLPGKGISPDTMKALLAAQGQSSDSDATASSRFAASADDFESEKSDNMPSGSITVVSGDGTTTTTTITLTMLHLEQPPLDMSVLTRLTGKEVSA